MKGACVRYMWYSPALIGEQTKGGGGPKPSERDADGRQFSADPFASTAQQGSAGELIFPATRASSAPSASAQARPRAKPTRMLRWAVTTGPARTLLELVDHSHGSQRIAQPSGHVRRRGLHCRLVHAGAAKQAQRLFGKLPVGARMRWGAAVLERANVAHLWLAQHAVRQPRRQLGWALRQWLAAVTLCVSGRDSPGPALPLQTAPSTKQRR